MAFGYMEGNFQMHILTKWRIASTPSIINSSHTYTHWDKEGKKIPIYSLALSMGEAVVKVISVSSLIFALPQEIRSIK